jgi:MOSC domain-containing protein YiiM
MQLHGEIVNISVSKAKAVSWKGASVLTGIFKEPVRSEVLVKRLGIVGDEQADLTVHGGPDKAVYAYPSEHYPFWKEALAGRDLSWGMFGENFTTAGLDEENVSIGDEFRVGTARLRVTQPRIPCFKLGMRFGDDQIIRRFFKSGKWGFYFAVVEEGSCERGDEIVYLSGDGHNVKVIDVVRLLLAREVDDLQFARVLDSNLAPQMKLTVARRSTPRTSYSHPT